MSQSEKRKKVEAENAALRKLHRLYVAMELMWTGILVGALAVTAMLLLK